MRAARLRHISRHRLYSLSPPCTLRVTNRAHSTLWHTALIAGPPCTGTIPPPPLTHTLSTLRHTRRTLYIAHHAQSHAASPLDAHTAHCAPCTVTCRHSTRTQHTAHQTAHSPGPCRAAQLRHTPRTSTPSYTMPAERAAHLWSQWQAPPRASFCCSTLCLFPGRRRRRLCRARPGCWHAADVPPACKTCINGAPARAPRTKVYISKHGRKAAS